MSEGGQIQALPSARSMLVVDYADRVESIAAFVERLEAAAAQAGQLRRASGTTTGELEVHYFHTHFIAVASAEKPLYSVLSPLGRVASMPKENRLLVVDYAANLEMARKVLARIDRPRPQVRITALIYDLSLQDVEQLGLNWGSAGKGNTVNASGDANQALQFETTTLAPFAAGEAGGTLTVRSLTRNFDINAVALLLQIGERRPPAGQPQRGRRRQRNSPNGKASPRSRTSKSRSPSSAGKSARRRSKRPASRCSVRPLIAGDGTVEMVVEPEFSRLAGFTPQEQSTDHRHPQGDHDRPRREPPDARAQRPSPAQRHGRLQRHSVPQGREVHRPAVPLARHQRARERADRVPHAGNRRLRR